MPRWTIRSSRCCVPVPTPEVARLTELVGGGAVVVLSGAGISTESGIPDYRGPSGASLRRHAPMTYQAFRDDPVARRRYWARSHVGWQLMRTATPNDGHRAVAALEDRGLAVGTITQNVDGLHQAAGSREVIDLHGRLDRVVCLACGATTTRAYFGENVPVARVEASYSMLDGARLLLVLGSSLTVFSGRRFVLRAAKDGIPVAIVNDGPTRGDELAVLKLETPLGETLTAVVDGLGAPVAQPT